MADATLTAVLELKDNMSAGLVKANEYLKALVDRTKDTGDAAKKTSEQISGFSKQIGTMASSLAEVSGIARLFTLDGLIHALRDSIQEAIAFSYEMKKLSSQMGLNTQVLQKYLFAADLVNVSAGELEASFRILQLRAQAAADGSEAANASFLALGISMKDNKNLLNDNDALFKLVTGRLKEVKNQSEFTTIGTELMGRTFSRLAPLVKEGTDAIDEYGKILKNAGGVVTDDAIDKTDKFDKQIKLLSASWTALKVNLISAVTGSGVLPLLVGAFGYVGAAIRQAWGMVQIWITALVGLGGTVYSLISGALKDLASVLSSLGGSVGDFFTGDWLSSAVKANQAWEKIADMPAKLASTLKVSTQGIKLDLEKIYEETGNDTDAMLAWGEQTQRAMRQISGETDKAATGVGSAAARMASDTENASHIVTIEAARIRAAREKEAADRETALRKKRDEKARLMDPSIAWAEAMQKMEDSMMTFQDVFLRVFDIMQGAFSSAIEKMLTKGGTFRDKMKAVFTDLKKSFIKLVADMAAQQMMAGILGIGGGSFLGGAGAAAAVPALGATAGAMASGAGTSAGMTALGGGAAAGGAGLLGIPGVTPLGIVGAAAGGYGVYQASKGGFSTNPYKNALGGAASGALAGASVGSIIPGVGTLVGGVVGGLIGGVAGLFGGKKAKKKKKEQEAEAQAAADAAIAQAAALLEEQRVEARKLLKTHIATTLGGGNASTDAADEVSALLSGDISNAELDKFGGAANVVGNQQAIQNLAGNVNVASPVVNISVGSIANSYDVDRLSQDIGQFLAGGLKTGLSTGA